MNTNTSNTDAVKEARKYERAVEQGFNTRELAAHFGITLKEARRRNKAIRDTWKK